MAISTTGITPANVFIPEIWASEVSDASQANIVLAGLVDRQYEDDMSFGRIVHIKDWSNPAVRIKSEDSTATWANITETDQDITISRQAYTAFLVEDIAEVQADVEVRARYTDKSGYSLSAFVEGDLTSGLASLPNGFSQNVGTLGVDPTDDDVLRAVQYLDDGNVPSDGRFFYVSPATHNALLKIDKFTRADFVGQADAEMAIKRAKVGMVYNAPVYMSSLANANPSTANSSYSWFCHTRGVALIMQREAVVNSDYVILETGWGVLVYSIYNFAERLIAPATLGGGTSTDRFNVSVSGP